MRRIPTGLSASFDHKPAPRRQVYRWQARKTKYYNPKGDCRRCQKPVPKHQLICYVCIEDDRWVAKEEDNYRDTLASIRADWYR